MPSFTLDLALDNPRVPERGDLVATARTVYRVLDSRPVDSTLWGNRWHLRLQVLARTTHEGIRAAVLEHHGGDPVPYVWWSDRYRPGETPAEYFGAP